MFCSISGTPPQTATEGPNSWFDSFDQPLSFAQLAPVYRQGFWGSYNRGCIQWQHANHWMADLNGVDQDGAPPWDIVGCTMRPNRSFRFEDRQWTSNHWGLPNQTEPMMVVETDYAQFITGYGGNAWGEIVITTDPTQDVDGRPTSNGLYAYDHFANNWTMGCRLERGYTCALFDNTNAGPGQGGRKWEVSHFQNEASAGLPQCGTWYLNDELGNSCSPVNGPRVCYEGNPDIGCRDHFRLELSRTRLAIYGAAPGQPLVLMAEWSLAGYPIPDAMLTGEVYVYLASNAFKTGADTTRFHWDRFVIQP